MEILKQKDNDYNNQYFFHFSGQTLKASFSFLVTQHFSVHSLYKNNNIDFEENKAPERFGECFFF